MVSAKSWIVSGFNRPALVHSIRTAVAATVSLAVARLLHLPEDYWAAVTTLVVMQSTLGAALNVSWKRMVGNALGALVGAVVTAFLPTSVLLFGAIVFALGLVSAALHLDRSAYRFAGITLAIIMLVARNKPAWIVASHRFIEVSVGIVVGLALTALWPDRHPTP